jgi:hypothetical protein
MSDAVQKNIYRRYEKQYNIGVAKNNIISALRKTILYRRCEKQYNVRRCEKQYIIGVAKNNIIST